MEYLFLKKIHAEIGGDWLDMSNGIFISKNSWLIGPYDNLKNYATNLRINYEAQQVLSQRRNPQDPSKELPVKFGRREKTDYFIPNAAIPKGGYKKAIAGLTRDETLLEKLNEKLKLRKVVPGIIHMNEELKDKYRLTDIYTAAADYFSNITLESHHIVEKSMLGEIKKNINDLANSLAPCVLIKGELHRRLFSAEGTRFRNKWNLKEGEIRSFYNDFYSTSDFSELKKIAELIIDQDKH